MSNCKQNIIAYCYDRKGILISTGYNSYTKSHPIQAHFAKLAGLPAKQFLHAEIDGILKARGKVIHSIHIRRIGKKGNDMLAAPCPICLLAIKAFGIKEVTFTV